MLHPLILNNFLNSLKKPSVKDLDCCAILIASLLNQSLEKVNHDWKTEKGDLKDYPRSFLNMNLRFILLRSTILHYPQSFP